eukprot:9584184-Karenia_brevis.AAC.1
MDPFGDFEDVKLPPDIRDELWYSVLLLGLCSCHIRWPVSSTVSCTDATPTSGGSVKAQSGPGGPRS